MVDFTVRDMGEKGNVLSALLDAALDELRTQAQKQAEAERDYRKARAKAWLEAPKGLAKYREAWVDSVTADHRFERDLAEGLRLSALELVRSRRAQISMLQSLLNAHRAEAEFVRTGPTR